MPQDSTILETCFLSLTPLSRGLSRLDEEERKVLSRHEELKAERKAEGRTTTDGYDSDDNANRGNQKKGRFHQTLAAITHLDAQSQQPRPETNLEKTLMRYMEAKMMPEANSVPLETRLKKLDDALEAKVITKEEHKRQRQRIIESAF